MNVPESLAVTTLGDVLGTLHRALATGRLDVVEGSTEAPRHRICLVRGLVDDVELAPQRSGELTLPLRLNALFELTNARLRFDSARPAPRSVGRLLAPREFLTGRPRYRDRRPARAVVAPGDPLGAYRILGLEPGADARSVRNAFRKLAFAHHPDRHAGASSVERARLIKRFRELSAAYHALVR